MVVLAAGLLLPLLFRLVSQEIGARTSGYQSGAVIALSLVVVFWVGKWAAHEHALDQLRERSYETGPPVKVSAFPQFLNPVGWYGVVETEKAYHLSFAGFGWVQSESERRRVRTLFKPEHSEALAAAEQGPQARIFLGFARHPLFQAVPIPEGFRVTLRDLRFDFASRFRQSFICSVMLDHSLRIVSEQFQF
jgi:hypothetical protein